MSDTIKTYEGPEGWTVSVNEVWIDGIYPSEAAARAAAVDPELERYWVMGREVVRKTLDELHARLAYYEDTLCLPGYPIQLAGGPTAKAIQPVRVGELVARLAAADELAEAVRAHTCVDVDSRSHAEIRSLAAALAKYEEARP